MISLNDMFGFECLPRNRIEQLMINSLNEQLQYHYNQRMFAWELLELEEEQIPHSTYKYHNNRSTVDHLMSKPHGLFFYLDDATRDRMNYEFITGILVKQFVCILDCVSFGCNPQKSHIRMRQRQEKCVCAESERT